MNGIHHNAHNHDHAGATNGTTGKAVETCPTCGAKITREKLEAILKLREARDEELAEERAALARERERLDRERAEVAEQAAAEESAKWEVEAQRAAREMARLRKEVEAERQRAARAHKKDLEAEARRRAAHEKEVERRVAKMQAALAEARAKAADDKQKARAKAEADAAAKVRDARREVEEAQRETVEALRAELKLTEQRRQRESDSLRREIVSLQRKAEAQRERGHFGIEGERGLLEMLRDEFEADRIEHHGTGGDVIQHVVDGGKVVAKILFEVKNTRAWSRSFVKQTREAMAKHETSFGLLVTRSMPARTAGMCVIDGVVVTVPAIAAQIVSVMREGIVAVARMDASERRSKTTALVKYLRGDEFCGAMKRVAVTVAELQRNLSRERAQHNTWFTTREVSYASVLREVAGVDVRVRELLSGAPANDNGGARDTEKVQ